MDKSTIPFVVKLKEYIDQRNTKIAEKKALMSGLRSQFQSKNTEISDMEAKYKQTFDDKLFDKIIKYKKDADEIQNNINKVSEVIGLMGTGELGYDSNVLEKEISSYIENAGFDDLKKSVISAKEKYLEAINNYESKLKEANSLRISMDSMCDNIPKELRDLIINTLGKHSKDFRYTDDMFIKAYDYDELPRKLNKDAIDIYMRKAGYGL